MLSNFKSIVVKTIGDKKTVTYKPENIAGDIEKKLNSGKIDLAGAMGELRAKLRYDLSSDDYRKIEKETGYNL